jgi:hypothetical protein
MRTKSKIRIALGILFGVTLTLASTSVYHALKGPKELEDVFSEIRVAPDIGVVKVAVSSGCSISRFGMNPYAAPKTARGAEWAIATKDIIMHKTGVSALEADRIVAMMRTGAADDVFEMGNLGGSSGHQYFSNTFDTTYMKNGKRFLCKDTKTNFVNDDKKEYGRLYHTSTGISVGEFLRCGNVTILYPGPRVPAIVPPVEVPSSGGPGGPYSVPPAFPRLVPGPVPTPTQPSVGVVNKVPEPGSLALVLLPLAFLLWKKK